MSKDRRDPKKVALWKQQIGATSLPGFDESLRLLIEEERYSRRDIGMMFDVSGERVRQWCNRRGLRTIERAETGLNAQRVWDDHEHRFRPVARGAINRAREVEATRQRKERRGQRKAQRHAEIMAALTTLRITLGRSPSWRELWQAISGIDITDGSCCARVVQAWDSRRTVSMAERTRIFLEETGHQPRPTGNPGHTSKRRPRTKALP